MKSASFFLALFATLAAAAPTTEPLIINTPYVYKPSTLCSFIYPSCEQNLVGFMPTHSVNLEWW